MAENWTAPGLPEAPPLEKMEPGQKNPRRDIHLKHNKNGGAADYDRGNAELNGRKRYPVTSQNPAAKTAMSEHLVVDTAETVPYENANLVRSVRILLKFFCEDAAFEGRNWWRWPGLRPTWHRSYDCRIGRA